MGKFDGILFVSDLDGTLLSGANNISAENIEKIRYFEKEGGIFTFVTGRVPLGIKPILEKLTPSAPIGCINGGGIYDCKADKMIWCAYLDEDYKKLVDFVEENFHTAGIEVTAEKNVYFSRMNDLMEEHRIMDDFPENYVNHNDIEEPVYKVLFTIDEGEMPSLIDALNSHPLAYKFDFTKSWHTYYEILPKNANKGNILLRLAEYLGIDKNKTIGIGDNENDIPMITMAKLGVAVANATDGVKRNADIVTVSNVDSAIARVIDDLDSGKIII